MLYNFQSLSKQIFQITRLSFKVTWKFGIWDFAIVQHFAWFRFDFKIKNNRRRSLLLRNITIYCFTSVQVFIQDTFKELSGNFWKTLCKNFKVTLLSLRAISIGSFTFFIQHVSYLNNRQIWRFLNKSSKMWKLINDKVL